MLTQPAKYVNHSLMVRRDDIYIFPVPENLYRFIEKVWSAFANKMVALRFFNDEPIFNHSVFEVIQDEALKIVASSTYFRLKEIANKKGQKDIDAFIAKTLPTSFQDPINLSVKFIQQAIIEFTQGKRPGIQVVNLREQTIHKNIEGLLTETMNYAVGLPLFVKENPIGILWGIRKDPFTKEQHKEATQQLSSLFDVIEFVVAKELDERLDPYYARKNIEKSDANSMSQFLFYTKVPKQKNPVTSIIFKSHSYDKIYRLDASFIIPTANGYHVSLKKFAPEQKNTSNKILLMIPGFFCRRSVMDKVAREMALRYGYQVFSMDMRGRSRQTLPPGGIRDGWTIDDYIQEDFPAVIDWLRKNYPEDKVVVVGHSMGGMIVRFYASAYHLIRKMNRHKILPDPEEHIAGVVSITSPNHIHLKTNILGLDALKRGMGMIPNNPLSDLLFNVTSTSMNTAFTTIDLNKFFKFLLNLHSSLRNFSFTIGTKMVNIKDFVGYKQISPSEWYFLVEDIFCEESTKVILQFIRSQLSGDKSFLSYDGSINYSAEQRNFMLPMYSVLGTLDAIAPADVLREDLLDFNAPNMVKVEYEQGHLGIIFHMETVRDMCKGINQWILDL
ncbi:MAG: alpha/beta fold hydrolase [Spirochaetota bacterium]